MEKDLLILSMQFFAEEEPNPVDDGPDSVVENPEPAVDDGVTPEQEAPEPEQEPAKPVQTAEENAAFARIRREAEARAQEIADRRIDEEYKRMYEGQVNPYTGQSIQNKADFVEYQRQHTLHQMAEKSGVSVQEQEAQVKRMLEHSPEYQQAKAEAQRAQADADEYLHALVKKRMEEDLAAIKKANPKETAKSIAELGGTFSKLVGVGIDPLTAYDLVLKERQRKAPQPPSMGDIGGSTDDSGLYTLEQLKSMSPEDMRKNWAKVEKSRKHIFK